MGGYVTGTGPRTGRPLPEGVRVDYPLAERAALLPSVVRLLLGSFLEGVAGADGFPDKETP